MVMQNRGLRRCGFCLGVKQAREVSVTGLVHNVIVAERKYSSREKKVIILFRVSYFLKGKSNNPKAKLSLKKLLNPEQKVLIHFFVKIIIFLFLCMQALEARTDRIFQKFCSILVIPSQIEEKNYKKYLF